MKKKILQTPDINCTKIDNSIVLLSKDGRELITLNSTAACIWELCNGEMSEDEITEKLYEQFSADYKQISKDVRSIINRLTNMGLLEITISE